jgi:hypothetical protein
MHATWAGRGETVDFVGDDVAVGSQALSWYCCIGVARAVSETKRGILLGCTDELALLPLSNTIFQVWSDEGVSSRIIDIDSERERVAQKHGATLGDNLGDLHMHLRLLLFASLLTELQIVDDGGKKTFNICKLATAGRNLKVELDELDSSGVGLDDLALEVVEVGKTQLVMGTLGLEGSGGLNLVVLCVAVLAGKGHDDDFAEIGDRCEQ